MEPLLCERLTSRAKNHSKEVGKTKTAEQVTGRMVRNAGSTGEATGGGGGGRTKPL